ncbi:MAG: hypothetical protein NTV66_01395, partial [Methylococcales bacterium]|nr:hypothetical protein [Methylococcales bacterium]
SSATKFFGKLFNLLYFRIKSTFVGFDDFHVNYYTSSSLIVTIFTLQDYKMLRVKTETYKQLKQIALDFDIPLTKLIDKLLEAHQKQKADS